MEPALPGTGKSIPRQQKRTSAKRSTTPPPPGKLAVETLNGSELEKEFLSFLKETLNKYE